MIVLDARTRIAAPARGHQRLPGVRWAVGMPDLHPGKGHPVGVAVLTDGIVYPHLVGSDIGCGVALFASDLSSRAARPDRLAKRLRGLEGAWEGDAAGWLLERGVTDPVFAESLSTIGGGNHFAELQAFETLEDPARVEALGLDESSLVLLVHSGSRGFGESILRAHVAEHGARGVDVDGGAGRSYLGSHDRAVTWASANRTLIAHRVATALGTEARPVLDVCHNAVTPWGGGWLHRKGAAPHDAGIAPIPGSRGTLTYLVEPTGDGIACGQSLAHGAGRKWTRSDARARMRERFRTADLLRTPLGGTVVCEDKDLLFEEAPAAYKRIDRVVGDLVDAGVCRVIAPLRPVVTYKIRRGPCS